jgi:tetratricopeptide (TPR) repeat protein
MALPVSRKRRAYVLAHTYAGVALHHLGKLDAALGHYGRVMALDAPIPEAYVNAARIHFGREAYDKADSVLARLLRRFPGNVEGLTQRGHVWVRKKDYPRALRYYRRVVELAPDSEDVKALIRLLSQR